MSEAVPDGWSREQVASVVCLEYGKSPAQVRDEAGQYPIIGTSGVVGSSSQYLWDQESVVIGRKGTIDRPLHVTTPFWAIDTTYFCRFLGDTSPSWFYYKICEERLERHNEASGVPSLSRETLYALWLDTPPLPEQKKIASILTSVDEVIENTQKQIDKLQDLKKATMNELLTKGIGHTEFKDSELGRIPEGWSVLTIEEYAKLGRGYAFKTSDFEVDGCPIIRVSNIDEGGSLDLSENIAHFRLDRALEFDSFRLKAEDFLLVMVGATTGKHAVVPPTRQALYLNQNMWRLRVRSQSHSQAFANFALQLTVKRYLNSMQGSAREFLTQKEFVKQLVLVPPPSEQAEITAVICAITKRLDLAKGRFDKTRDLKRSLMQDLLTGKVRVSVD